MNKCGVWGAGLRHRGRGKVSKAGLSPDDAFHSLGEQGFAESLGTRGPLRAVLAGCQRQGAWGDWEAAPQVRGPRRPAQRGLGQPLCDRVGTTTSVSLEPKAEA